MTVPKCRKKYEFLKSKNILLKKKKYLFGTPIKILKQSKNFS